MRYTVEEGLFGATSAADLKIAAESFFADNKLKFDVVECEDGIEISPDLGSEIDINEDFQCASTMCNSGRFGKARKLLKGILEKRPLMGDVYRNLAQVEMMEKNIDLAITINEKAIRIQPTNYWALILMGNLYSREKGDHEKGLDYYNRALSIKDDSALALCNVAAIYEQMEKYDEARELFEKSISVDKTYLNSYFGLAGCVLHEGDARKVFDVLVDGLRSGTDRPENSPTLRKEMVSMLMQVTRLLCRDLHGVLPFVEEKRVALEKLGGLPIRVVEDKSVPFAARMEIANKRGRDYHQVSYHPERAVSQNFKQDILSHLVMHELGHLDLWIDSDKQGLNEVHMGNGVGLKKFAEKVQPELSSEIIRMLEGDKAKVMDFIEQLYSGLSSQVMNCVEDIFVEEKLFQETPELRPLQFISMLSMEKDNLNSVRMGQQHGMPRSVVRTSRILNLVTSLNFTKMWGFSLVEHYEAKSDDMRLAKELYGEIVKVLRDYHTGDEYPLIRKFVKALHFEDYIVIEKERDHFKSEAEKRERQASFDEHHKNGGDESLKKKMACMMCVALKRLKALPIDEVRAIAAQIAMLGVNGIDPNKESGYKVLSMPDLDMSGYECLSYYYVSWAIGFPDKLKVLRLPFEDAYRMALELYED